MTVFHRSVWLASLLSLAFAASAQANVRVPAVIGNNMVLQQGIPLPIWGWADAGEDVTVTFRDKMLTVKADAAGKWKVTLPAIETAAAADEMLIKGKNLIHIKNILVGEVWAGSGQSNMQWSVQQSANAQEEIAKANHPKIRLFIVPLIPAGSPADDVQAQWVECSPQTVAGSSAVLYFFGREIHQQMKTPVGLITTAWGGTRIQPWIPPQGYTAIPELADEKQKMLDTLNGYASGLAEAVKCVVGIVLGEEAAQVGDLAHRGVELLVVDLQRSVALRLQADVGQPREGGHRAAARAGQRAQPAQHAQRRRIGLPHAGTWREILNTDAAAYGGTNAGNGGAIVAEPVPAHGFPCSAAVTLPPLATVWFEHAAAPDPR
jgi:hypothetical protein